MKKLEKLNSKKIDLKKSLIKGGDTSALESSFSDGGDRTTEHLYTWNSYIGHYQCDHKSDWKN